MRVFIGIRPDGEAREKIESVVAPLRRDFSHLRWVPEKNRHLTLKFLGEKSAAEVIGLREFLSKVQPPVKKFSLTIQGLGGFGQKGALRVLWAGVTAPPGLISLHHWLESRLEELGVAREERPFHPHITLARNKRNLPTISLQKRLESFSESVISTCTVSRFQTFQSRLSPEGPEYSILEETHLDHQ